LRAVAAQQPLTNLELSARHSQPGPVNHKPAKLLLLLLVQMLSLLIYSHSQTWPCHDGPTPLLLLLPVLLLLLSMLLTRRFQTCLPHHAPTIAGHLILKPFSAHGHMIKYLRGLTRAQDFATVQKQA
jgi:hypothetical protein